ncbi:MAG: four-helix bundle copper-binding protein [Egibacteraceae bacterium]
MTSAHDVLATIPEPTVGLEETARAIDALFECERAATACALAMVAEGQMTSEVHAALDNADLCQAAQRVLTRTAAQDEQVLRSTLQACIAACERSARECGAHADQHGHCRIHSDSARTCAQACSALLETIAA